MNICVFLLSSLYIITGSKECTPCGSSKHWKQIVGEENEERIIGGDIAPPHAFPWMVYLREGCAG